MLSPFRGFMDVQGEVNRMFDEVLGGLPGRFGGRRVETNVWSPAIDVLSRDGDVVIRAELPGMKREDVDIRLQNGMLTISGERETEHDERHGGYYMRERRWGSFRRSVMLPEGVDEAGIQARFQDGVLEVTVAGATAVQEPKRIQIEGGEESGGDVEDSTG